MAEVVAGYQKTSNELVHQVSLLKTTIEQVEKEREFYFSKLREIGTPCNLFPLSNPTELFIQATTEAGISRETEKAFKEIQSIMYKVEEGFTNPEDAEA